MLTTEDLQKLTVQAQTGKPSGVTGPEADQYLKDIKSDVVLAKKKGWTLAVPGEWPDLSDREGLD